MPLTPPPSVVFFFVVLRLEFCLVYHGLPTKECPSAKQFLPSTLLACGHVVGSADARGWTPLSCACTAQWCCSWTSQAPRCGGGSWLAWTAREAPAGRRSWALLDVASPRCPLATLRRGSGLRYPCTLTDTDKRTMISSHVLEPSTRQDTSGFLSSRQTGSPQGV